MEGGTGHTVQGAAAQEDAATERQDKGVSGQGQTVISDS